MPFFFALEEALAFPLAEENLGYLCALLLFLLCILPLSQKLEMKGGTRRSYISTHTALAMSVTKLEIKQVVVADGCGPQGKSEING